MTISIPDQLIGEVLSGVVSILAVIAAGFLLFIILRKIAGKYPFTRLGSAIALAPLILFSALESSESTVLLFFAMTAVLLGVAIDGIAYLILPEKALQAARHPAEQAEGAAASNPALIAWENAVKICTRLVIVFLVVMAVLFLSKVRVSDEADRMIDEPAEASTNNTGRQADEVSEVDERFDRVFEQINANSNALTTILAAVETTQESITELSGNMESLQEDLAEDRSSRAASELPHSAAASAVTSECSCFPSHTFNMEAHADRIPFPPELKGTICIASEFPFESYLRMTDTTLDEADRRSAGQRFLQEIKESPKTFWVSVEDTDLIGQYRKTRSFEILESMEAEVFREETEDLKKFIETSGKTSP